MNECTDPEKNTEKIWKTPRFKEIPISFEASSYALTDDDPPYR
jgi:coenzyme PQQ precursor peptide PqqA